MKYGEIEGFFGVLVTLYHIRKLLSSHGIKPAFEMLEEKFKQRYDNMILLLFHIIRQFAISHRLRKSEIDVFFRVKYL